jgi:hypothetical protein
MSKLPTSTSKDVIYIDVDDEITAIIEKVTSSAHKIVALVLPKRSATLQSIVNMKLLQRSSTAAKKNLVLITSDANLLPLAGAVGMHVAKTPQSKPYIPLQPATNDDDQEEITAQEDDDSDFDVEAKGAVAVGELVAATEKDDETIELDNSVADTSEKKRDIPKKSSKKSGPKVPDFIKFRKLFIAGVFAFIVLIAGGAYAFITMPYSNILIATDTQQVSNTMDVLFDATTQKVLADPETVPSVVERVERTNTETVAASGERNDGEKATGTLTLTLCASSMFEVKSVPAGTGASTGGKNYITQKTAVFDFAKKQTCTSGKFTFSSDNIPIVAQAGGAGYNVEDANFTVAGSTATGVGSASDGTDDIKKIVVQADIDSSTKKLESKVDDTAKEELQRRLESKGLLVIKESFVTTNTAVVSNVPVGTEAADVTVTRKTMNTMIGAKESDMNELITKMVEKDIDPGKQKVLSTGLDQVVFQLQNQQEDSAKVLMSMDIKSTVGPELNDQKIKDSVAGMKAGEAEKLIGSYPGVTKVDITYGPFWVSSIPKDTAKITIIHEK